MKVAICTPTMTRPLPAYFTSLEASVPALDAAGIEHNTVFEVGCPYISAARSTMLSKAMKWGADAVVFIDHDMEWEPDNLVRLITTQGDVVSGTYRYKTDEHITYMGALNTDPEQHKPMGRKDGCLSAYRIPAGFMKITMAGVERFKAAFPELVVNDGGIDLFNHGVCNGIWYGEDMAFSRRWVNEMKEQIWLIPDMNLNHHDSNGNVFKGNFHEFLLRQPGGSKSASPIAPPQLRAA